MSKEIKVYIDHEQAIAAMEAALDCFGDQSEYSLARANLIKLKQMPVTGKVWVMTLRQEE